MNIILDDLLGPEIAAFLEEHIEEMRSVSPPESKHALDLESLRQPEISFWTAWDEEALIGCCALKRIDGGHGEIKSMRVAASRRGEGIGSALLKHLLGEGKTRGYGRLSLETGSMNFFEPARALYARFGFTVCGPFGTYGKDPNSVFMSLDFSGSNGDG